MKRTISLLCALLIVVSCISTSAWAGTISNAGIFINNGTISNTGTISGSAAIDNTNGRIYNVNDRGSITANVTGNSPIAVANTAGSLSNVGENGKNGFDVTFSDDANDVRFLFTAPTGTTTTQKFFVQFRISDDADSAWVAYHAMPTGNYGTIDFKEGTYTKVRVYAWDIEKEQPKGDYLANFDINLVIKDDVDFPAPENSLSVARTAEPVSGDENDGEYYYYYVYGFALDYAKYGFYAVQFSDDAYISYFPVYMVNGRAGKFEFPSVNAITLYAQSGAKSENAYTVTRSKPYSCSSIGILDSKDYSLVFSLNEETRELTYAIEMLQASDTLNSPDGYRVALSNESGYQSGGIAAKDSSKNAAFDLSFTHFLYGTITYTRATIWRSAGETLDDPDIPVADFALTDNVLTLRQTSDSFPTQSSEIQVLKVRNEDNTFYYAVKGLDANARCSYMLALNDGKSNYDIPYALTMDDSGSYRTVSIANDLYTEVKSCYLTACYGTAESVGYALNWTMNFPVNEIKKSD